MSGTKAGALKTVETRKRLYGEDSYRKLASEAGKHNKRGGFASEKVGKDGLTGRQRAAISGRKGGSLSSGNFKNDPQRAKELAQNYWKLQKELEDENSEVHS